jgi:hypothetical protein
MYLDISVDKCMEKGEQQGMVISSIALYNEEAGEYTLIVYGFRHIREW